MTTGAILLLIALVFVVLIIGFGVKRFLTWNPEIERERSRQFNEKYYRDK